MAQIHPLENKTKLVSLLVSGGEVHVPRSIFLVKPGAGIRYKTSHQNPKKQAPGWPWQSRVSEFPRKVTGDRNRQERGSTASLRVAFLNTPLPRLPPPGNLEGKVWDLGITEEEEETGRKEKDGRKEERGEERKEGEMEGWNLSLSRV